MEAEVKIRAQKRKKSLMIAVPCLIVAIISGSLIFGMLKRNNMYEKALESFENGNYQEAMSGFEALGNYKDSAARYTQAEQKQYPAKPIYDKILKDGSKRDVNLDILDLLYKNASFLLYAR